jgi:hypothetical protein
MKKRGGIRVKSRRPKRAAPKHRAAKKVRRVGGLSAAGAQERLDVLKRELREASEQQSATAEVLRIVSASPGDLQPVFEAMLANATRLCQASFGTMWLAEGERNEFMRTAALYGLLPAGGAEAQFTKQIDFLMLHNEIEMRVERAA